MSCPHCRDTNACDCIVCGSDRMISNNVRRVDGPCLMCKGRAYHLQHMATLQQFCPSIRANWRHHPASDGNKGWKEYIPLDVVK